MLRSPLRDPSPHFSLLLPASRSLLCLSTLSAIAHLEALRDAQIDRVPASKMEKPLSTPEMEKGSLDLGALLNPLLDSTFVV